jgi:hypothetical protein
MNILYLSENIHQEVLLVNRLPQEVQHEDDQQQLNDEYTYSKKYLNLMGMTSKEKL